MKGYEYGCREIHWYWSSKKSGRLRCSSCHSGLEAEQPLVLVLDDNPLSFNPLIQLHCSPELSNETFVMDQKNHLLRRELEVGNLAGTLYVLRHDTLPVYLVDGSFQEPLSETGQEIGV